MTLNGVRQSPNLIGVKFVPENGECAMALSLRDSAQLVSDPEKLSSSVFEVFGTMLGVNCEAVQSTIPHSPIGAAESVTAVVGFGGILSGACVITCGELSARQIASRMTGMAFEDLDDVVKDAIGEICNMVAGAWKSSVPGLAANCGLSVPAVITGRDYNLHMQSPEFRVVRDFRFDESEFQVAIVCDELL